MRLFNHPLLCNYYLTYRCNARCSFCDIWEKPSPYATLAHVKANLHDLKRLGVRVIDFTGGEPLLHRGLPAMLALAKALGFITTVTTNTLLYPKYAKQLQGKVDMLHFSLDFPDAERHNASRGVNCYDHLLHSMEVAASLGERPELLYTVTNSSVEGIEQVYHELAKPRGLMLLLNPVFGYGDAGAELSPAHFATLRSWSKRRNVYLNEAFLALRERGGNQVHAPVCKAGSSTVVISPANELLLPCYHLAAQALPLADDLYAQWNRPEVQALVQQEGRLPACQGCAINCYMQPSFAYQVNSYFFMALPATLKYAVEKWILAKLNPLPQVELSTVNSQLIG